MKPRFFQIQPAWVALLAIGLIAACDTGVDPLSNDPTEFNQQTAALDSAIDPTTCVSKLLTGACQSQAQWQAVAEETCTALGAIPQSLSLSSPCTNGTFKRAAFQCCKPASPCKSSMLQGVCQSQAQLQQAADNQCKTLGLALTSSSFSNPCPNGTFRRIDFQCCPVVVDVCCKTTAGFQILPSTQCPASQQVAMEQCLTPPDEPCYVCCKTPVGPMILDSDQCPDTLLVPMEVCAPSIDVCCKTPAGPQVVNAANCPVAQMLPPDQCKDDEVCCETATGYQILPQSQCVSGAIVPMELCEPAQMVCCKINGGFFVVPASQCPTGSVAPPEFCCQPTLDGACCLPTGACVMTTDCGCEQKGGQFSPGVTCDAANTICKTPCDKAIFGQCPGFDYTAQCDPAGFDCTSFAILGDQNCDGFYEVCVECPPGTYPVDMDGDGCEEMCDCCPPLVCPAGTVPTDTDGNDCPDICKPKPCDKAVYGQCKGFDYTAQCDPKGLDCGPAGILGDPNCDGIYEVCLLCPPGTVPMDYDGDGCEEICDCCPLIACPVGTQAIDSDGNGCPDKCSSTTLDPTK